MASKPSLRNSIFSPHFAAMSLAMSYSRPVLMSLGSASPVPQKFGPGRLVTTLSTPALIGLQSTVPPLGVLPAAAVVLAPAAVVAAALVVSDDLESLPHAASSRPSALSPTNRCLVLMDLPGRCSRPAACAAGAADVSPAPAQPAWSPANAV